MTPAKPRLGRPPLPEGEARTVKVLVALTPAEAERLDAARGDTSRAEWLRRPAAIGKPKR